MGWDVRHDVKASADFLPVGVATVTAVMWRAGHDMTAAHRRASMQVRQNRRAHGGSMMLRIVVIEEDTAMRTLLCEWLEAEGYRARGLSANAPEGEPGIDLVIVDLLDLPRRGAEAVRHTRSRYPGAALIGISTQLSRTLAADSPQARALGVDALVTKPCTSNELLAQVARAIGAAH